MHFATIDCGTTNSRVYLLDERLRVVTHGARKVGVRDTALTGSRLALREGLRVLLEETVRSAGIGVQDLACAVTSGMITSEIGLLEIPHLTAPVGLDDLAAQVTPVRDPEVFPAPVELVCIRGVKNRYPTEATCRDLRLIDFMRGEETQVMGLLARPDAPAPPLTAVVLSSHTKYIPVTADGRIAGSLTTLSGQLFEAIRSGTSIGKSVEVSGADAEYWDAAVADAAYDAVVHAGFLRALLMPRFLEVLLRVPAPARRLFLAAAIVAEDLRTLREFPLLGFDADAPFVLIGSAARCRIFRHLLVRRQGSPPPIREVSEDGAVDRLSILGAAAIARRAGYLGDVVDS